MTHSQLEAKAREEAGRIVRKHFGDSVHITLENALTLSIASTILPHLKRIQELEEGLKMVVGNIPEPHDCAIGGPEHCKWCIAAALLKEGK